MKYIRYNDKIYKTDDLILTDKIRIIDLELNIDKIVDVVECEIADTIEELLIEGLDYLVFFKNDKPFAIAPIEDDNLKIAKSCWKNKCKVAIWTDKGLIYVAKMNDKGEFELIW